MQVLTQSPFHVELHLTPLVHNPFWLVLQLFNIFWLFLHLIAEFDNSAGKQFSGFYDDKHYSVH